MKKNKRNAFILKECNSAYIQEAIFVLKDGVDSGTSGVLQDAERIVSAYMQDSPYRKNKQEKAIPLPLFMLVSSFALFATCFGIYQLL